VKNPVPDRAAKPIRERLDTTGFAFPKPGAREKAQPKDGRLVESPREYSATKRSMWEKQRGRCARVKENGNVCNRFMPSPAHGHRHHPGGRGMGGGKRDDSKTVLWCIECHVEEHL
jgi:hypothetical protein